MQTTTASDAAGPDRRHYRRVRTLLTGQLNQGERVADGVVLNLSVSGAKVRLAEPSFLGAIVKMRIARLGEFRGQVVWRARNRMGVRFLDTPGDTSAIMTGFLPDDCLAV